MTDDPDDAPAVPDLAGDEAMSRDDMLRILDGAISEAARKVDSGRVYDEDKESTRQGWVRALAYAINIRRQVEKDKQLDEMAERLERLEEMRNGDGRPLPGGIDR